MLSRENPIEREHSRKKEKKKAEKSGRPNWDKMIEIGNFLKTGIFLPPFH